MTEHAEALFLEDAEPPTEEGWYGIILWADEGEGFAPAIWAAAEYWENGKWRCSLMGAGSYRSACKFDTEKEAKNWAIEEIDR